MNRLNHPGTRSYSAHTDRVLARATIAATLGMALFYIIWSME